MVLMFAGTVGYSLVGTGPSPSDSHSQPEAKSAQISAPTPGSGVAAQPLPASSASSVAPTAVASVVATPAVATPVVISEAKGTPPVQSAIAPLQSAVATSEPGTSAPRVPVAALPLTLPMLPPPPVEKMMVAAPTTVAAQRPTEQPAIVVSKAPTVSKPEQSQPAPATSASTVSPASAPSNTTAASQNATAPQAQKPTETVTPEVAKPAAHPPAHPQPTPKKKLHRLHFEIAATSNEAQSGDDADAPERARVVTVNVGDSGTQEPSKPKSAKPSPDAPASANGSAPKAAPATPAMKDSDFSEIKAATTNQFLTYAPASKDAQPKEGYTPGLVEAAPGGLVAWVRVSPTRTVAVKKGDTIPGYGKVDSISPDSVVTDKGTISKLKE